eukprot:4492056-Pyramimonas_sp.AAC.1
MQLLLPKNNQSDLSSEGPLSAVEAPVPRDADRELDTKDPVGGLKPEDAERPVDALTPDAAEPALAALALLLLAEPRDEERTATDSRSFFSPSGESWLAALA